MLLGDSPSAPYPARLRGARTARHGRFSSGRAFASDAEFCCRLGPGADALLTPVRMVRRPCLGIAQRQPEVSYDKQDREGEVQTVDKFNMHGEVPHQQVRGK